MKLPNQSSNIQRLNSVAEASDRGASPSQFFSVPAYLVGYSPNSCFFDCIYNGHSWRGCLDACFRINFPY
jgi:hypothetical protein